MTPLSESANPEQPPRSTVKIESAADYFAAMDSDDHQVRQSAVTGTAGVELWEAALREYPDRRGAVALNKNLPEEILDALARGDDPRVRRLTAQKRRLSEAAFNFLARDPDEGVRLVLASNPKLPGQIRDLLLQDEWSEVRDAAASR
jgi:hypothetical protein